MSDTTPYIPISDIPAEWKDGRAVDFYCPIYGRRFPDCFWVINEQRGGDGWRGLPADAEPTHAMLPPKTPEEK